MADEANPRKIKVSKEGPYLVSGGIPLAEDRIICDERGVPVRWKTGREYQIREDYLLCRCGRSSNKPFCDGSHEGAGFDETEAANREDYLLEAETTSGPDLVMTDVVKLCALARFCLRDGDAWTLTENSDDPKSRQTAIEEIHDCPSGRLVAWDKKSGLQIEPVLEPSIGLVEGPGTETSGPIWVKGGIPVEASDGTVYQVRNRVTLCRCGRSCNKPFCDGAHEKTKTVAPEG